MSDAYIKPDLLVDVSNNPEMMSKLQDVSYAQSLYAGLCNTTWQKKDVYEILANKNWHASWRYVAQVISELSHSRGGYMAFYCSGVGDDLSATDEGVVTPQIRTDLENLGWVQLD